ncbi:hypothetical protein Riggi_69 [Bacillus phage Riggi]|uniref:DNA binding domain protein n=2 Tax=Andromedavirus TaxID=1623275 RepID=U5PWU0_9CAUD|nr:hypothetical protein Riggi_69 [Bacillus phage Riggi]AGY48231.1 hypothetical protein Riggi_69 [Bacillus phage Riggi]QKN88259.1 putative ParG-like protein [Bacillus phage Novomoskovsk]
MKKVKSVAFNVSDPMELALYEYALSHKYFSTYVKRLIQRDFEQGKRQDMSIYEEASRLYRETEKEEL